MCGSLCILVPLLISLSGLRPVVDLLWFCKMLPQYPAIGYFKRPYAFSARFELLVDLLVRCYFRKRARLRALMTYGCSQFVLQLTLRILDYPHCSWVFVEDLRASAIPFADNQRYNCVTKKNVVVTSACRIYVCTGNHPLNVWNQFRLVFVFFTGEWAFHCFRSEPQVDSFPMLAPVLYNSRVIFRGSMCSSIL